MLAALASILACQIVPTPPPLRSTPRPLLTTESPGTRAAATEPAPAQVSPPPPNPPPGELAAIPYRGVEPFAQIALQNWRLAGATNSAGGPARFSLPYPLTEVINRSVADGLTLRQQDQLARQGFVIVHSRENQFSELRSRVALFYGQPYYLTSDAAYHALKISFDELQAALEREELKRRLQSLVEAVLAEVVSYIPLVEDSDLELPTNLAAAYLSVALRLLDPLAPLDPGLESQVSVQVAQILAARGVEQSKLIPGYQDDFRRYLPEGRYAAVSELQGYFRAITWLERVNFQPILSGSTIGEDYVPLIVTLALRQAKTANGSAAEEWARIVETLNFFSGLRTGGGPPEYALLMDQAFGQNLTILGLKDAPQRKEFQTLLRDLPFPQLEPRLAITPMNGQDPSNWSFLSVRYNLDELILEDLAPEPATNTETPRLLPGGLEVMSVLGASAALDAMRQSGAEFRSYPEEIARLRIALADQTREQWSASARNLWLEGFRDHLAFVQEPLPAAVSLPYLEQAGWEFKDLNSALGSWAELQHDTTEFTPVPAAGLEMRPLTAPPAPGFVEPNPQVFYQLARLAFSAADGLKQRDLVGVFSSNPALDGLNRLLLEMLDLADRLQRLGDIAVKELRGEPLDVADFALIQAPLGPAEKRVYASMLAEQESDWVRMPPLPAIVTLDFEGDRILQIGVGGVDRIYVLAPLGGEVMIAQGGVYSYYEFSLHRSRAINETAWRKMLVDSPPPPPEWVTKSLYLLEGVPIDALAYRIGEFYRVKPAAVNLSLRGSPGRDARIVQIAAPGEILEIVEGSVAANGLIWWKVRVDRKTSEPIEGWIFENQDWIERAWDY